MPPLPGNGASMRRARCSCFCRIGASDRFPMVFAIFVGGEVLADMQLKKFRADPANKGRVCGLRAVALVRRVLSRLPVAHQHVCFRCNRAWSHELRSQDHRHRRNGCHCLMSSSAPPSSGCARVPRRGWPAATRKATPSFADEMAARAIAEHSDEANAQHYEVPAAFFRACARPKSQIFIVLLQGAGVDAAGGRGRGAAPDRRAR